MGNSEVLAEDLVQCRCTCARSQTDCPSFEAQDRAVRPWRLIARVLLLLLTDCDTRNCSCHAWRDELMFVVALANNLKPSNLLHVMSPQHTVTRTNRKKICHDWCPSCFQWRSWTSVNALLLYPLITNACLSVLSVFLICRVWVLS